MIIESMECSLGIALFNLERVYLQKKKEEEEVWQITVFHDTDV